jgi:hypothetical protein
MTLAQQNFKKAIAYRQKTGCSLKEAFAHVKGSKVAATPKKVGAKKTVYITGGNKTFVGKKGVVLNSNYNGAIIVKVGTKKVVVQNGDYSFTKPKNVGAYKVVEVGEKASTPPKVIQVKRNATGTYKKFNVIGAFFDTSVIKDLDSLKKQYYKLSKKYHPDAGGTTLQFQDLQKEYEKLFNTILKGGNLNKEQQDNEVVIDKEIRNIIDNLITLENITVEVIGKWLWVGGNTYPLRTILSSVGLEFIRKAGTPYWVYKGVESSGRGKMTMDEIKAKYGVHKFDLKAPKKISGFNGKFNRTKLKNSLIKLKKALDKRPI